MARGKGGGPKTPAGKARSSRNAVKHGINTPDPLLIEGLEDSDEMYAFLDAIVDSLKPEGAFEQDLAETIAANRWRHRRVLRWETAVINHQVQLTPQQLAVADAYLAGTLKEALATGNLPEVAPDRVRAHQEAQVVPMGTNLAMIMRYESNLHRQWIQTLHELQALQAYRRGEKTPLMRVSFTGPPV